MKLSPAGNEARNAKREAAVDRREDSIENFARIGQ